MSLNDMDNYRSVLNHIVRPEDPTERVEADVIRLEDYEALYLYSSLVEWASYNAGSAEAEQIALGYAEYINDVVRNEQKNFVNLYAHTAKAENILLDVCRADDGNVSPINSVREEIESQ